MSQKAAKVPGASRPLTHEQKVRVIVARLHDPKILCTQADRDLLADFIVRAEEMRQALLRTDSGILFTGERTHSRH